MTRISLTVDGARVGGGDTDVTGAAVDGGVADEDVTADEVPAGADVSVVGTASDEADPAHADSSTPATFATRTGPPTRIAASCRTEHRFPERGAGRIRATSPKIE